LSLDSGAIQAFFNVKGHSSWQQSYMMKYIHGNGMDNKEINYFIVKKIENYKEKGDKI